MDEHTTELAEVVCFCFVFHDEFICSSISTNLVPGLDLSVGEILGLVGEMGEKSSLAPVHYSSQPPCCTTEFFDGPNSEFTYRLHF